jgi:hydrogenase nickel incorporation protein HypA/HybF
MHELSIAQEMLKVALDYAAKNNARKITQLNVEMSAAADESEDSLRFHFENSTRGTIAESARVEISCAAARAKCFECSNEFDLEEIAECPQCSSPRVRMLPHDEFTLISIDVE